MLTQEFDYHLPTQLIAQSPALRRDHSRLLVVHPDGTPVHEQFYSLGKYLRAGDLLVMNRARVSAFILKGVKEETGAKIEMLFMRRCSGPDLAEYWVLAKPMRRCSAGVRIICEGGIVGEVIVREGDTLKVRLWARDTSESLESLIARYSRPPLPPYIKRDCGASEASLNSDWERYQTVYARDEGSVAAPTAGLHFTESLLQSLSQKGVEIRFLTLHVDRGTFTPISTDKIEAHRMHEERYEVPPETWQAVSEAVEGQRRLFVVGTTVVRTLEHVARLQAKGEPAPLNGSTNLYIYPGYRFQLPIRGLLTNFHLPRSTLLLLVSAFAGISRVRQVYQEAMQRGYRFFSYGDACLFLSGS